MGEGVRKWNPTPGHCEKMEGEEEEEGGGEGRIEAT